MYIGLQKIKDVIDYIDVAFPIVHGTNVEDGTLQGYLQMLNLPYVGCDVVSSAVGMDKYVMKTVFKDNGIPVLDCVCADAADYELPSEATLTLPGKAEQLPIMREDHRPVEKSLLEPALRTPDMNAYELACAGYLDSQLALRWWHRNVAKSQYGLQGWRRHKVYPDFVFGYHPQGNQARVVLLETKGMHLDNEDTGYKQALLARLTQAFRDERFHGVGTLALEQGGLVDLACDLVFDQNWAADLDTRFFGHSAQRQFVGGAGVRLAAD